VVSIRLGHSNTLLLSWIKHTVGDIKRRKKKKREREKKKEKDA